MADLNYLNQFYLDNFGRPIGKEGADYWGQSDLTGQALESAILGGAKGNDRNTALNINYNQNFGRDVGQEGLNYWGADDQWKLATQNGVNGFDQTLINGANENDFNSYVGGLGSSGQQEPPDWMSQLQTQYDGLMGGLNSLFGQWGDAMKNQTSQFQSMFDDMSQKQNAANNPWQTDFNQSSVLPPQYQVGSGAKNGSSMNYANANPWNVKTF